MDSQISDLEIWSSALFKNLFKHYQRVIVGCSGGIDSIVLSWLIWRFTKEQKNFSLALVHVNYGLRGEESNLDATFVDEFANSLSVPCFTHVVSKQRRDAHPGEGTQEWARR